MDLETENRLAALLMEESRRLRQQADKEGVHVYLHQPKVRGRPNSRFLTATVLGVQQANRTVEVNEMWRAREKELELDRKLLGRSNDKTRHRGERHHGDPSKESSSARHEKAAKDSSFSSSSSSDKHKDLYSEEDDGLRDEEIDEFLRTRVKRGRGAIGSRMDEPGPYPTSTSSDHEELPILDSELRVQEEWERRVLGPEKPPFLRSHEEPEDDDAREMKKIKKDEPSSSKKQGHSKEKHRSEKSRKKKKEERSKRHHRSR